MTDYRRYRLEGGTYFFTVNLAERNRTLLTEHIDTLRKAFRAVKKAYSFRVEAIVILPDHLHAVWSLPQGDHDFSLRWRQIKSEFSMALEKGERISSSCLRKRERGIWQRRFWEHAIRDYEDFARHVDYIHCNPVKHGYVRQVADWPYFSFDIYLQRGVCSEDWVGAGSCDVDFE